MTETTAAPTADTRQFTPAEIAVAVAKRLVRHAEFDENWLAVIAERGIDLADDGMFTITTEGGQTFHLTVAEGGQPSEVAQLREQVATQKQVLELVTAQTNDAVEQVDAALGHRYHTAGVHFSVPAVAEKAAADLKQLEGQRDAALALIDGYDGSSEISLLARISAALGGAR